MLRVVFPLKNRNLSSEKLEEARKKIQLRITDLTNIIIKDC